MKQPWMKFFPIDWRADPTLRQCSVGARGLWIDLICLMHEAEPYGHLVSNNQKIDERSIGLLTNIDRRSVKHLLDELERNGVFARTESGIIYSRRMVRDYEKIQRDKENGRRGGNPKLVKGGVNPPVNGGDNGGDKAICYMLEARSKKEESVLEESPSKPIESIQNSSMCGSRKTRTRTHAHAEKFEEFWKAYPRREGSNPKHPAKQKFDAAVQAGTDPEWIITGAKRYAAESKQQNIIQTPKVAQALTWLNQRRWGDYQPDRPMNGHAAKHVPTPEEMAINKRMAEEGAKLFDEFGYLKPY